MSARQIGWAATNSKRLNVVPDCGVLGPQEFVLMKVSCNAFDFSAKDTSNDAIIILWTNTPTGAAKQFCQEWLEDDATVRRRKIPIKYQF